MSAEIDHLIDTAVAGAAVRGRRAAVRMPQVSLLPTEIRTANHGRRARGLIVAGVLAVALLAGAAAALASTAAADADQQQADATGRLSQAAAQLARFKDVQSLQQRVALGDAAVAVGSSTAIDWQRWLDFVEADLPPGFTVTTVTADSATPFGQYAQGTSPIERPRAATVQITVDSASIDGLPVWLRRLKSLPAYADLSSQVSSTETGYTVQVTLHLTTEAYVTPLKGAQG